MDRYPGEYQNDYESWLEAQDEVDTPVNRRAFDDKLQDEAEAMQQGWIEEGVGYSKPKPLNSWAAYMEEMRRTLTRRRS